MIALKADEYREGPTQEMKYSGSYLPIREVQDGSSTMTCWVNLARPKASDIPFCREEDETRSRSEVVVMMGYPSGPDD